MDEHGRPPLVTTTTGDNLNTLLAARVAAMPDDPMIERKAGPDAP